MTTVVLGSSFLSASLLTMLVPMAAVVAMVAWGVFLIRRHERHARARRFAQPTASRCGRAPGFALAPGGLMDPTSAPATPLGARRSQSVRGCLWLAVAAVA